MSENTDLVDGDKFIDGWSSGLPETRCGAGSKLSNTLNQRRFITMIIRKYNIKTISDIGAGDLNWISKTDLLGAEYKGYDLIPRHPKVKQFDILKEVPQKSDLIMCFWVLNHFSYDDCKKALDNIKKSNSTYLMMTDRKKLYEFQPKEIQMEPLESLLLNKEKCDSVKFIKL